MRRKIFQWFQRRQKELDLLEEYFPLVFTRWQALLWGGGVLAIGWGVRFIVSEWPAWINWTAVLVALFFAGYYVWREDHIRLVSQLRVEKEVYVLETPTSFETQRQIYIQAGIRCKTASPAHECRGHLVRVQMPSTQGEWQDTEMNESLYLGWSNRGHDPITLYPGTEPRLNICFWTNASPQIHPQVPGVPIRAEAMFRSGGPFRFDVSVTSEECAPLDFSVLVRRSGREWNKPIVKLITGAEENGESAI
jgi:hypothetical protein